MVGDVVISFSVRRVLTGEHEHVAIFAGPTDGARALCGQIVMRPAEADELERRLTEERHNYFARVVRDQHTGTVMLQLLDNAETVQLQEGDEFVTLVTKVDLAAAP